MQPIYDSFCIGSYPVATTSAAIAIIPNVRLFIKHLWGM